VQQVSPIAQATPLQAQAPPTQVSGALQTLPQAPQFWLELERSAHNPELALQQTAGEVHATGPHGHDPFVEQLPSLQQSAPLAQAGFVPQAHCPALQLSPGLQA
jgi:hypothetical protein